MPRRRGVHLAPAPEGYARVVVVDRAGLERVNLQIDLGWFDERLVAWFRTMLNRRDPQRGFLLLRGAERPPTAASTPTTPARDGASRRPRAR